MRMEKTSIAIFGLFATDRPPVVLGPTLGGVRDSNRGVSRNRPTSAIVLHY